MANLKSTDLLKLEKLFDMSGGYVLDFTNATFQQFIRNNANVDIYSSKYETYGDSKAKRLRAFWDTESDTIVGKMLDEMVEHWRTLKILSDSEISAPQEALSKECMGIARRLQCKTVQTPVTPLKTTSEADFLQHNYGKVYLKNLNLEGGLESVLEQRIKETQKCLKEQASLSVIFLCGSMLEGILLGIATKKPAKFNKAKASPKDKNTGKVLPFHLWTLNDLINVAHEIGVLGLDVKRFSHALRDFRNFIHPYEQWRSGFNPDKHTAEICWQVLKAAINDLGKI